MRISQIAARTGLSVHALRFYERKGLLPRVARSQSNYREFSPSSVERVTFIRKAQELGFTLAEIQMLVDLRNTPMGCTELKKVGERKLAEVDAELRRLRTIRKSLHGLLRDCDRAAAGAASRACNVQFAVQLTRRA